MSEWTEGTPPQSGGENRGVEDDVKDAGDAGRRSAAATPPIGEDAVAEQTQTPAASDDVGVPPDEEMNRPT